jgi:DGQHR domain-containing protein
MAKTNQQKVKAILLQASPPVYVVIFSGRWLLKHTTPSWRSKNPQEGFQRIVREERAKQIARTVLDRGRTFPNAITLATNLKDFKRDGDEISIPKKVKFLVVDGQHRLWAQKYSDSDCQYVCIVHLKKTEKEMAELFLEINDNQPADDEAAITASDLVYELATRKESPFYISIDLTGEQKDVSIKQGSLAPEIKTLVSKAKRKHNPTFEEYLTLLIRFFAAIRSLNPQGWGDPASTYYKAKVLRALVRLLVDIVAEARSLTEITAETLLKKLQKIDPTTLSDERVRAAQGSAGVIDLYTEIKNQVFA